MTDEELRDKIIRGFRQIHRNERVLLGLAEPIDYTPTTTCNVLTAATLFASPSVTATPSASFSMTATPSASFSMTATPSASFSVTAATSASPLINPTGTTWTIHRSLTSNQLTLTPYASAGNAATTAASAASSSNSQFVSIQPVEVKTEGLTKQEVFEANVTCW